MLWWISNGWKTWIPNTDNTCYLNEIICKRNSNGGSMYCANMIIKTSFQNIIPSEKIF